jgi:hypothetical protein
MKKSFIKLSPDAERHFQCRFVASDVGDAVKFLAQRRLRNVVTSLKRRKWDKISQSSSWFQFNKTFFFFVTDEEQNKLDR